MREKGHIFKMLNRLKPDILFITGKLSEFKRIVLFQFTKVQKFPTNTVSTIYQQAEIAI